MAFAVAAVPAQSIYNSSGYYLNDSNAIENADIAASVLWAEMELDAQYSFSTADSPDSDIAAYIVPAPLDLATTTSSRWLTDVIGINPSCVWSSTNITGIAMDNTWYLGVNLQDADLDVTVGFLSIISFVDTMEDLNVLNHTTQAPPSDGSTVLLLGQCVAGCDMSLLTASYAWLNFTSLPTFQWNRTDGLYELAFLVCKPNVQISTREVRNNGFGMLSVQPSPNGVNLKTQGNLHPRQTPALFSFAMMHAGPSTLQGAYYVDLGADVQQDFLFGREQVNNLPTSPGSIVNLTVLPTANLSLTFTSMLKSSSKAYLTGSLGTAYVPGRLLTFEVVFATSLPQLAVSTAIFILLFILTIVAHFRRGKGGDWTLINIAAAMHDSEVPAQFSQMKADLCQGSRLWWDRKS
ncbi:hypothetical protein DEU56DRAFT_903754, partial [Suillus clintonianus]|uniref:uncharacterized protein n=1 Tax=Suillus clintonianus TaxID=1904413 RepID=UPI001B869974